MSKTLNITFLLFIVTLIAPLKGYPFINKDISVLTMQAGMSDNHVLSIFKDSEGFMWFGTNNGLNRYDGSSIDNYSLDISTNMIVSQVANLSEECLGLIINEKLYAFNRQTEQFIPLMIDGKSIELNQFLCDDNGILYTIKSNQLDVFELQEAKNDNRTVDYHIKHLQIAKEICNKNHSISKFNFSETKNELLFISDDFELVLYNLKANRIDTKVALNRKNKHHRVNAIMDYAGLIWISTVADGIITYDRKTHLSNEINYNDDARKSKLSHTDVFNITPLENGSLLAVTWNGYTILNPVEGDYNNLKADIHDNTSFTNRNLVTRMICSYYDSQNIIWIGTAGGGIIYADLRKDYYNQYHQNRHNEICSIVSDNDGYIWLSTFHKGIMKSTHPFNVSMPLSFEPVESDYHALKETIFCSDKDNKGNLWFGSKSGEIIQYNKNTGFKIHKLIVDSLVSKATIWALKIDSKNNFWIGTESGLLSYIPESNVCTKISVDTSSIKGKEIIIRAIEETQDGKLWVGSYFNGIRQVKNGAISSKEYGKLKNLHNLSVRSLLGASDGNLYIGYGTGFGILNTKVEEIIDFLTTANGLCNNNIGCLVEDDKGQIWVGSNSAISQYMRHNKTFYNYYISGSNRSAYLYDGELFWGNNKALTYFDTDKINTALYTDRIIVKELEINSKKVEIGENINGQVILNKNIFYTDRIELNAANRNFSLLFNNLSYLQEKPNYQYRLYPYQDSWITANKNEKISYINLPPGNYIFEIQNIYPNENIGHKSSLHVIIRPHWSETTLFEALIVLCICLAFIGILLRIKYIQKRRERDLNLRQEVFAAKIERDKEKQIRLEREAFFTNAAHELRTPLTLILSPLQEIIYKLNKTDLFYDKLSAIYSNGTSLHSLVDKLLYVQKIEAEMVKLRLSEVEILSEIEAIVSPFRQLADTQNIEFTNKYEEDSIKLWVDKEKILSAIQNLLSNAFKYTHQGGKINLEMKRVEIDNKWYCEIEIKDTGIGIRKDMQDTIFESFATGCSTPQLSTKMGIGLRIVKSTINLHHGKIKLRSKEGEGSIFTIYIPEGKEHFLDYEYEIAKRKVNTFNKQESIHTNRTIAQNTNSSQNKLLIIEDNEELRSYMCSLFVNEYILIEATNGEEGVEMAIRHVPDIIISDIMMPLKDGFTCCKEIREEPTTTHIPILMLTAKAEDSDRLIASNIGVDGYITKPFNPQILKSRVENLIIQRKRLKRIYTKVLMLNIEDESEEKNSFVKQVMQVIEVNLSKTEFSVKQLSEGLNMSQPTLYRKLKPHTELSAIDMIRSMRMCKAASLLLENRYSVQEIAEHVGYIDIRTLRKHFTKQFGVSPSKFTKDIYESSNAMDI